MSLHLAKLQKQLCSVLQKGLSICDRPFAEIAKSLGCDEREVLQQTRKLRDEGLIRRISALINYCALGMTSTLVAAHIRRANLKDVIEAINSLENVSHNYLRQHYYNLWFTLQARRAEQIEITLSNLSARFDVDFHSLPVERVFKLDVRFDAQNGGGLFEDVREIPKSKAVELNDNQKLILSKLQGDLDVVAKPFDFLCSEDFQSGDALRIITELIDKGIIRRIAAVVDHRKLGFVANVLFAGEVRRDKITKSGKRLARLPIVSHCYERGTFRDWPYNLFAMMHSRSMNEIQEVISKFIEAEKIDSFQMLPTVAELKKQPVRYCF